MTVGRQFSLSSAFSSQTKTSCLQAPRGCSMPGWIFCTLAGLPQTSTCAQCDTVTHTWSLKCLKELRALYYKTNRNRNCKFSVNLVQRCRGKKRTVSVCLLHFLFASVCDEQHASLGQTGVGISTSINFFMSQQPRCSETERQHFLCKFSSRYGAQQH